MKSFNIPSDKLTVMRIKESIATLRRLRQENITLRSKIAEKGGKCRWQRKLSENQRICRREFLSISLKIGGGATLLSLIGYGGISLLSSRKTAKLIEIENIVQSLGGRIVYRSERLSEYNKFAVVFPLYHTDHPNVPTRPIITQGRIMIQLAREVEINNILAEGSIYGESVQRVQLSGSEDQILNRVIRDLSAPPNLAVDGVLGNRVSIIGIDDRALFLKSSSMKLLQQIALDPNNISLVMGQVLSLPDNMTGEVNRYTREYCEELGISFRSGSARNPISGERKEIVVPQITQVSRVRVIEFSTQEMSRLINERSSSFVTNTLTIFNNIDAAFVQLEIGAAHLNPTYELLEENGIGVLVVSNDGINAFIHEHFVDDARIPQYMRE